MNLYRALIPLRLLKDDKIPGEVCRIVQHEETSTSPLAKSIYSMINKVFEQNEFPTEWKKFCVVPIFKRCVKEDPNNNRGVSLINTLFKVLADRLMPLNVHRSR